VGAESAPTFTIWGRKAPPYIINDGFNGKIKEAYEKYENIIFSGFSTLNFVLSTMAVHIPQELRIRSRGTERHSASN
jgi:hypothetical protein